MTVPLLDPTKLRRQRQIMGLLLGLVLLMALIAGAALWLAVRQAQQLAQPNLHNEPVADLLRCAPNWIARWTPRGTPRAAKAKPTTWRSVSKSSPA